METNKINEGSDCRGAIHCALDPWSGLGRGRNELRPYRPPNWAPGCHPERSEGSLRPARARPFAALRV